MQQSLMQAMEPLPIRRRLTILGDGSTRASDLVFCEPSGGSVPLSRCATCGHGGAVTHDARGRAGTVDCCRVTLQTARSVDDPPPSGVRLRGAGVVELAASLPVGLSLVRPAICVSFDAPLRVAMRALAAEPSAYGVAVVDHEHRFVGTLPRATAALALLHSSDGAAEHMTAEWCSVDEAQSLGEAFAMMTARHARELTVVGEGRAFVGTVRDIDALRFVAYVSRTGLRPPLARVA
jgi:hypothetical protein